MGNLEPCQRIPSDDIDGTDSGRASIQLPLSFLLLSKRSLYSPMYPMSLPLADLVYIKKLPDVVLSFNVPSHPIAHLFFYLSVFLLYP